MFNKLFANEAIKKTVLSQFAKKMQSEGIKRILITVEDNGEILFEPLNEALALVEKKDYDFYRNFFLNNKKY